MKKKVILIDAVSREIKFAEYDDYTEIYKLLNCETFQIATYLENEDAIYVDEEGLLTNPQHFFEYKGAHQPFAGNGLIIGADDEGESVDAKIDIEEVRKNVRFLNIYEVRKKLGI